MEQKYGSVAGTLIERDRRRVLVILKKQAELCEGVAGSIATAWNVFGPTIIGALGDKLMEEDRARVRAGWQLAQQSLTSIEEPNSEASKGLLDLYEEESKLCGLASQPEGSYLTYLAESERAAQGVEGKLARAAVVVGRLGEGEEQQWGKEWELATKRAEAEVIERVQAQRKLEFEMDQARERLAAKARAESAAKGATSNLYLEEGWRRDSPPKTAQPASRSGSGAGMKLLGDGVGRLRESGGGVKEQRSDGKGVVLYDGPDWRVGLAQRAELARQALLRGTGARPACEELQRYSSLIDPAGVSVRDAAILRQVEKGAGGCLGRDHSWAADQLRQVVEKLVGGRTEP